MLNKLCRRLEARLGNKDGCGNVARGTVDKARGVGASEVLSIMAKTLIKLVMEGGRDATKMAKD